MSSSFYFRFEAGISTLSLKAAFAFLILVSMSAMGSLHITFPSSPACFLDTGEFSLGSQLSKADSAQPELSVNRSGPTTNAASIVLSYLELGFAFPLLDNRFLSHALPPHTRALLKGTPRRAQSLLASSSVLAVVTTIMSIPCTLFT